MGNGWACRSLGPGLLTILLLAFAAPASAEGGTLRGVALVIGNGGYAHLPALANPSNDARAVESLLSDLGFETTLSSDRDARRLARDLDIFVEDAEGADVAILYYAGHGIEAGGENFLVPVDADMTALEAAGTRLVPISAFVERLQATVPVAILMLDACRDNPFPAGAMVTLDAASEPAPMGESGLGETRGAVRLGTADDAAAAPDVSVGTVIGFAAEPGRTALDGPEGGNSPYAAALLRHFDTMAGEEFGLVMRMVAEEVYLKTAGRQRPWVNESLRRLLYFGAVPDPVEGEEGEILSERRQLLVTIAELPDPKRRQVEAVARDGGVPMDGLYAVLRALGTEIPDNPSRLDAMLRSQADALREMTAERAAWSGTDGELVRLASLAGSAMEEGALETAIRLHERAKERVSDLEVTIDDVEAEIRNRRIEFAGVFADSAAAYEVAFDYRQAAADYMKAFEQVERWDDALAWDYRRRWIVARYRDGEYRGDAAALEEVAAQAGEIERLAARLVSDEARAEALLQLGNVHNVLGRLRSQAASYESAIAAYEAAIVLFDTAGDTAGAARARNNLAGALGALGAEDADTARLDRAIGIYRALAEDASFEESSVEWMTARLNLASAVSRLGERSPDTALAREAMTILEEIVERVSPSVDPIPWAVSQFNLAGTMLFVGQREGNPRMLADSVLAGQQVLEIWSREAFPIYWASVNNNIGNAYQVLGHDLDDPQFLQAAEYQYRDALEEWRRDRVPNDWAMATNNLANVLKQLGDREDDFARLDEAIRAYRACMEVWTRADSPLSWASAQNNLGDALFITGSKTGDAALLREAVSAFDNARLEWTYDTVPYDWAVATNNRGGALVALGRVSASAELIREGIADIEAAWRFDKDMGVDDYDAYYEARLADARAALGEAGE